MAQTATTTTLMSTQNPSVVNPYGQPSGVTLYVTISPNPGSGNGTVRFTDNGADISGCGSVQVQSGATSCSMSSGLPMGTRSIVAYYSGGTGYAASASSTLTQYSVRGPSVAASYAASSIRQDQSTTLTITLANPNSVALGGVSLPSTDLSSFSGATLGAGTCSAPSISSGSVSLSNQTLAANSSCTIVVNIPAGQPTGTRSVNPRSPTATTANGVSGFSLTGSSGGQQNLTVTAGIPAPPTITVSRTTFPATIAVGATTQLTFTLSNPNAFLITGVGTTLTLPSELVIHQNSGSDFTTTCTNASLLGSTGGNSVRLIGGRMSANGSCTFTVTVRGASAGSVSVPTGAPSATNAAAGTEGPPLAITVNPVLTVTQAVASTVLTQNVVATPFTPVTASGGAGPLTYAITFGGALPTGLIFSTSTGQISGAPTSTQARTTYNVTVTDRSVPTAITATTTFDLTVNAAFTPTPTLTFANPTSASVTLGGSLTNAATSTLSGGAYGAISYTSSNTAVATVGAGGVITPVGVGTATITATQAAVGGVNAQAVQSYGLTVAPPPAPPQAPTVAPVFVNVAYNSLGQAFTLLASGEFTALTVATAPTNGKVTIDGTTATYLPTPGFFGVDSFTYSARGPGGASTETTVTLEVARPSAPTVAAASANVAFNSVGQTVNLTTSGVFTTLAVAIAPTNGKVTIDGATAIYVPAPGFYGVDSFTYTATGPGGVSAPATVTLIVASPPPPTVVSLPATTTTTIVPTATSGLGASVIVDLSALATGSVTGFEVTVPGQYGQATIEEANLGPAMALAEDGARSGGSRASLVRSYRLRYTPTAGFMGVDAVTLVAVGPGGRSAPIVFTFNVPGKAPDLSAQVLSSGALTLTPTEGVVGGPFQGLRITRAPTFGTATVSGLGLVFTPGAANSGVTSLDYVVELPFGSSEAGRIDLRSNPIPIVAPIKITTQAGRPVTVSLTASAQGGPFISAAVTGQSVPSAGTVVLTAGGEAAARTYDLTFTPDGQFDGLVEVKFTLSNGFATSTGVVQIKVEPRPDPALDPDVRALVSGQADTARRFARAQTDNFSRRLEQIRGGDNRSHNDLTVNMDAFRDNKRAPNVESQQQLGMEVDEQGRSPRDRAYQAQERAFLDGFKRRDTALSFSPSAGLSDAASGPRTRAWSPSKVGVWAGGSLDWGRRDAQGLRDTRFSTSGVSGGADLKVRDNLILGGGLGYGDDHTSIGAQGTESDSQTLVGVLYGSWRAGPALHLEGLIGYGRLNYDSRRWSIQEPGSALGQRAGDLTFGAIGMAYDRQLGRSARSFYGRMESSRASLGAFTETGAGISALRYEAITSETLTSNLGVKLEWIFDAPTAVFAPSVRVEWRHEFQEPGDQTITYADWLASPRYGVKLEGWSRDSLSLDLGGRWTVGESLDIDASYRNTAGSNGSSQGLQLKLMTRF